MICPACDLSFDNVDSFGDHLENHQQYELVEAIINNEQFKQKISETIVELRKKADAIIATLSNILEGQNK